MEFAVCVKIEYSIPRDDEMEVNCFGDLIKKKRLEKGLFQKELASILGVNKNTIIGWEFRGRMSQKPQMDKFIEFFEFDGSILVWNILEFDTH